MLRHEVISKFEYNKKFASIEENSDKIYECFEAGGHDIKKLEAQLGIVSE